MKVATNMPMLIQNCHASSDGVEKFSALQRRSVAASNSPTTAGRSPVKMLCTTGVFIYFMNIRLIRIIRMSDGKTSAKVATVLPSIAMPCPIPAF